MDFQSEMMLDLFTNSPFLGFLIWQYITQRRDYKEAQEEMRNIREKAKMEEEKIRERWEGVVAKLDSERKEFMSEGVERMSKIENEVNSIKNLTEKLSNIEKDSEESKKSMVVLAEEIKDIRYTAFEIVNALAKDRAKREKD